MDSTSMYLVSVLLLLLFLLLFSTLHDKICIRKLIQAKQVAEETVAAKSATLATLSHEIRTPLTGVLSVVHLLRNTTLDETQQKLLGTLNSSGNELLSLLNQTLEQSRIEAGQLSIVSEHFVLDDLVNSLLTLADAWACEKGLLLTANVDPALPAVLVGDAGKIRQILLNLLSNAIKFTASGIVKLQIDKLCQDNSGITVCFKVTDSGIGMTQETVEQLFTPFHQGQNIQRRFGGTGLGLSISRELARAMGGNIEATSAENRGSVFTLLLPMATGLLPMATGLLPMATGPLPMATGHAAPSTQYPHTGTPVPPEPATTVPSLKLLVVDDTDIHRMTARCLLESAGHRVTLAASATEAMALLEWQTFAGILLDIRMPDVSGIDAIRQIRQMKHPRQQQPCIIVLSALLEQEDIEELLACGADAACSKPMDLQSISQILASIPNPGQTEGQNVNPLLPHRRDSRIS
ncbi:MAG: response regulator [Pseudomonadales bacterium]|nr:response regulator [Pseudomonadales bacterium]